MTAVAEVTIAADAFGVGEALSTDASSGIELARFVPVDTSLAPYFWVETTDEDSFEAAVRGDSRVVGLARQERRAGRTLYRVDWATDDDVFFDVVDDLDVLVERGHETDGNWSFRLRLPDRAVLRTLHSRCQEQELPLRVNWVSEGGIRTERPEAAAVGGGEEPGRLWRGGETTASSTTGPERPLGGTSELETMFRQIVENLEAVVWLSDPDKEEILYANPAYETVWGRPREELREEPLSFVDAIHPDDRDRVRTALESQAEGEYEEEYRIERPDGTIRWIRDRAIPIRDASGDVHRIAGIAEDVTERKERERDLVRTSRTLEALASSFPDLAFVIDEDGRYREYLAGAEAESLLYADPGDLLGARLHEVLPTDTADELLEVIRRSLDTGELQTVEYRLAVRGDIHWFEGRVTPLQDAPTDARAAVLVARDVTERKKREHVLTGLHETTRALFRADSREDVVDLAVEAASERLQLSLVSGYLFDESSGVLRPVARTPDVDETLGDLPTFTGPESLAWNAFVDGETRVYDDVRTHEAVYDSATPIRSELIVPLGDSGVLLAGDTTTDTIDDTDVEFAELLATAIEEALDHVEYEQLLEDQNERLADLSRLNRVIRSINRTVVDATTQTEIAANVCENIVENDPYYAAWVGEHRADRAVTIHTRAGFGDEVVESETVPADEASLMGELAATTYETGAVHVIQDLRDEPNVDPWHERLLAEGCRGVVAVPLAAGKATYGIMTVYADQPAAFEGEEVAILRELGQTIGRAMRAVEARRTLVAESAVELEFEVTDEHSIFVAASADLECRLSLEGVVPVEEGRMLYYVSADRTTPDALRERLLESPAVETCRLIAETEDGGVFEIRVAGASGVLALVDYGATVRSAVAEDGDARITVEVAPATDVQAVRNALRRICPSAALIGKRQLDRPVQTADQFRESLTQHLTEKQLYSLRAAYFAGYFEWPRESTAEEIAGPMEVASSTFHFHLRHALRKLLVAFFETQSREAGLSEGDSPF